MKYQNVKYKNKLFKMVDGFFSALCYTFKIKKIISVWEWLTVCHQRLILFDNNTRYDTGKLWKFIHTEYNSCTQTKMCIHLGWKCAFFDVLLYELFSRFCHNNILENVLQLSSILLKWAPPWCSWLYKGTYIFSS